MQNGPTKPGPGSAERSAGEEARMQLQEYFPVVQRVLPRLEQRGREVCGVTYRQEVEDHIVVLVFQGVAGRKDNVGVARRLIQVEIDGNHEFELGQPFIELPPVGAGEDGVACYGKHSTDLPFPRRQYLFGHYRRRQLIS